MNNNLSNTLKEVKLTDISELIMGQSPPGASYNNNKKGIPLLNGAADFKNKQIVPNQFTTKPTKLSKKGDILFCIRATIGKVTLSDGEYCLGRGVAALRVNESAIDKKYLMKILDNELKHLVLQGSTIKGLKKEDLGKLNITIPELSIQRKITATLEKAEKAQELREETDELTERFLKSIFSEVFGHQKINNKKFPTKSFLDVFNITTGKLNSNAAKSDGKYPFFTCSKETFYIDSYLFDCEALILSGNNAAGEYSIKHYKGKFNAYQRTYILSLKDPESSYLFYKELLEQKLEELKNKSIGTNTKYLTLGILSRIDLIVPPNSLQKQFDNTVSEMAQIKTRQKSAKEQINNLLNVLIQKAIDGELAC